MNRRKFLGFVCSGVVATVVATKLPLDILPKSVKREGALNFLTRAYNAETKGKGQPRPTELIVGRDLFEAVEDELVVTKRFSPDPYTFNTFRFKHLRLSYEGRGWNIVRWVY